MKRTWLAVVGLDCSVWTKRRIDLGGKMYYIQLLDIMMSRVICLCPDMS